MSSRRGFVRGYFALVLRHRGVTLGLCALITALAILSASRAVVASSIGKLFLDDMPEYQTYQQEIQDFANDEFFLVAYENPKPLAARSVERLRRAVTRIEKLPDVARVTSLLDAIRTRDDAGTLVVERYVDVARQESVEEATRELAADPVYAGTLLARDGSGAALAVELEVDPYRPVERGPQLVAEVMDELVLQGFAAGGLHRAGLPALIAEVMEQAYFNMGRLFPISVVALLAVVWLLYRRLAPALVTLGIGMVSVIWTLGFAALLDREFSVFTAIVPAVILTVAFSDIIHLFGAYHLELMAGRPKSQAILESASDVGAACLLTSLTTFTGFVSLSVVPTPVSRQLGAVLGFGVAVALLLAMTLVPIAFSLMPVPRLRPGEDARRLLDRIAAACAWLTRRHPWPVLGAFVLAAIPIVWGLLNLTIGTDFLERFAEGNDYRRDAAYFEKHFAGTSSVTVLITAASPGGLANESRMARAGLLQDAIEELADVDEVLSAVDVLRAVNRTLVGEDALPTAPGSIAQYLLLLEMADTEGLAALDRQLDFDRARMRLEVRTRLTGFRELGRLGLAIDRLAPAILGDSARAEVTGVAYLLGSYFDDVLRGQRLGLALSLAVIALMMAIGVRSVTAGALAMIPNLLPLMVLGAVASFRYEVVDSDLLIVALMAIGIGVDDTIHFLMRYRIEIDRAGQGREEAGTRTFRYVGRSIVMTTVILCAGFLPFALSDYFSVGMLGTFLPVTLLAAVLGDLLLLPAMLEVGFIRFSPH